MAFKPFSAKAAKVRFGSTTYTAKRWNVTPKVDVLDITNFESGGFDDSIGGIQMVTASIDADYDGNANPFDAPVSLQAGNIGTAAKLYTNDLASAFWSIPSFLVEEAPTDADVRQSFKVNVKIRGKGQFVYPTGTS